MASEEFVPVITSLLDTDLYKITMQAAVLGNFSDAGTYLSYRKFFHRPLIYMIE